MELVAAAEGCDILGISRARWYQMVEEPGFPRPVAVLSCGSIYDGSEIRALARKRASEKAAEQARRNARLAVRAANKARAAVKTEGRERVPVPPLPEGITLP